MSTQQEGWHRLFKENASIASRLTINIVELNKKETSLMRRLAKKAVNCILSILFTNLPYGIKSFSDILFFIVL